MAKDVRAGKAYVELGLKEKVDAGLQAVAKRLRAFGTTAIVIGSGITAAAGAAFGSVMFAAKSFADTGDAIGKMAGRTGIGIEALQELSFAAGQSGTDIETLEAATRKMSKVVTDSLDGLNGPAESLRSIGIDPSQLAGLSVEDQFQTIAEALGAVDNATRKAALAQEIFGKSGTQLLPMLNGGASGLAALRQEARDLGGVMSEENVIAAEALTDAFGRVKTATAGFIAMAGSLAAKPLTAVATGMARVVAIGTRFVSENQGLIFTIAKVAAGVAAAGAAIFGLGSAALAAGVVLPLLSGAISTIAGFAVSFLAPLLAVGAAIGAVAAVAWMNRDRVIAFGLAFWDTIAPIREALTAIYGQVVETFGAIANAIGGGDLKLAGAIAVSALVEVFLQGMQMIGGVISQGMEWIQTTFGVNLSGIATYVLSVFDGMGSAIASGQFALAADIAWATIKLAFVGGIGGVKLLWSGFTVGLAEVWGTMSNGIVGVFRGAMGLVLGVMQGAISQLAEITAKVAEYDPTGMTGRLASTMQSVSQMAGATSDQLARDQESANAARLAGQVANGQAMLNAEQRFSDEIAGARAERDKLIAQAQSAAGDDLLAAAGQQRADLVAQANDLNNGGLFAGLRSQLDALLADADNAGRVAGGSKYDSMLSEVDKSLNAGANTPKNVGSFSAVGAALAGMGGGNIQDKIAKASEETRKNTGRMVDKLDGVATNLKNIPQPTFS